MSFRSSFLELKTWLLVNVPLMGEMDLHTFWGEADLRFCAYCVPPNATSSLTASSSSNARTSSNNNTGPNGLPKLHPQATNQYLFSVEIKHQSNHRTLTKASEFAAADTIDPCANGALVTDAVSVAEGGSNGGIHSQTHPLKHLPWTPHIPFTHLHTVSPTLLIPQSSQLNLSPLNPPCQ